MHKKLQGRNSCQYYTQKLFVKNSSEVALSIQEKDCHILGGTGSADPSQEWILHYFTHFSLSITHLSFGDLSRYLRPKYLWWVGGN